jgi:hypothetical protein
MHHPRRLHKSAGVKILFIRVKAKLQRSTFLFFAYSGTSVSHIYPVEEKQIQDMIY